MKYARYTATAILRNKAITQISQTIFKYAVDNGDAEYLLKADELRKAKII